MQILSLRADYEDKWTKYWQLWLRLGHPRRFCLILRGDSLSWGHLGAPAGHLSGAATHLPLAKQCLYQELTMHDESSILAWQLRQGTVHREIECYNYTVLHSGCTQDMLGWLMSRHWASMVSDMPLTIHFNHTEMRNVTNPDKLQKLFMKTCGINFMPWVFVCDIRELSPSLCETTHCLHYRVRIILWDTKAAWLVHCAQIWATSANLFWCKERCILLPAAWQRLNMCLKIWTLSTWLKNGSYLLFLIVGKCLGK